MNSFVVTNKTVIIVSGLGIECCFCTYLELGNMSLEFMIAVFESSFKFERNKNVLSMYYK